jgi:uncharacterized protein RhaS with RHS repeats
MGRRATKTVNDLPTTFRYDGLDVIQETTDDTDVTYLRSLAIEEALTRTTGTDTLHYIGDALGSSLALTDASGAMTASYTCAPFGETAISGTSSPSPFQFTGRENDGTGLYYYRARYYDPC